MDTEASAQGRLTSDGGSYALSVIRCRRSHGERSSHKDQVRDHDRLQREAAGYTEAFEKEDETLRFNVGVTGSAAIVPTTTRFLPECLAEYIRRSASRINSARL